MYREVTYVGNYKWRKKGLILRLFYPIVYYIRNKNSLSYNDCSRIDDFYYPMDSGYKILLKYRIIAQLVLFLQKK